MSWVNLLAMYSVSTSKLLFFPVSTVDDDGGVDDRFVVKLKRGVNARGVNAQSPSSQSESHLDLDFWEGIRG